MPTEVIMPKVDMDMATGKITVWHAREGADVVKSAPLFDIETDKAAMEVESPATGTLRHLAPIGTEIAIGAPVAWIYTQGEVVSDIPETPDVAAPEPTVPASEAAVVKTPDTARAGTGPRMTPAARRLAREGGLDPQTLKGTGPRERIQAADVAAVLAPRTPRPQGTGIPLVMIHGFAGDAQTWAAVEAHLPAGQTVITLELPGHGSAPRQPVQDFAQLAALMRREFDALDIGSAHLVGHSLGGAIALALADTRPRRVASVTLLCPAGLGPDLNGPAVRGIAGASKPESMGPWLKTLVADPDVITPNFVQVAAAQRRDPQLRAGQIELADVLFPDDTQSFDLVAALHRLSCPVRLIWGKRDQIIPWRHALRAPGRAALHLFDNAGHLPQFEVAEEIAGLLQDLR
ncbi:MAG: acetoin dehydrogenase dihydrolipoyllysine-residue acetyltransferase subunit [Pseudomonadota bacterium]